MSRRVLKPRLPRLRAGALGGNGSLVSASAEARGSRMIKPEDLEASDRHFVEQVMLSIRMLRGEIGQGDGGDARMQRAYARSEEHTSELQSLISISYAVFCLK